ncbi:Zinc finger protein CONSTANS-LIKE 2 [Dorcoceras hygrometricum]|uniref:Zinc finger protein CONSTANS-LIKE 2 n=1 Tax=Dorcoceras hygrometricum TaxID=472368 RepID=A0A2Z7CLD3_9LAMI|nr:Zinc finger protein CONSTANS-LIKE 2 [Dorcoceras hygrometricum]
MLKLEKHGGDGPHTWARACDTCRSAACTVYCRADMAYLCGSCDARIHAANLLASRHERVWVCEACERAPAAFLCNADAASLCTSCDSDIHSANPLARRHHRVPILPIRGFLYGPPAPRPGDAAVEDDLLTQEGDDADEEDEDEAASWLLLNPSKNRDNQSNEIEGLFGEEVDEYFDLDDYNPCQNNQFNDQYNTTQQNYSTVSQRNHGDSVVPIQNCKEKDNLFQMGFECKATNLGFPFRRWMLAWFRSQQRRSSQSPTQDLRKGTIDLFSGPPIQAPALQLTPMDREARVLRYREKKKARKFEKTIRYASRKAYAETRPRIKGRFAKRRDVEVEVDQMFSTSLMAETGYGMVPSY